MYEIFIDVCQIKISEKDDKIVLELPSTTYTPAPPYPIKNKKAGNNHNNHSEYKNNEPKTSEHKIERPRQTREITQPNKPNSIQIMGQDKGNDSLSTEKYTLKFLYSEANPELPQAERKKLIHEHLDKLQKCFDKLVTLNESVYDDATLQKQQADKQIQPQKEANMRKKQPTLVISNNFPPTNITGTNNSNSLFTNPNKPSTTENNKPNDHFNAHKESSNPFKTPSSNPNTSYNNSNNIPAYSMNMFSKNTANYNPNSNANNNTNYNTNYRYNSNSVSYTDNNTHSRPSNSIFGDNTSLLMHNPQKMQQKWNSYKDNPTSLFSQTTNNNNQNIGLFGNMQNDGGSIRSSSMNRSKNNRKGPNFA